MIVNSNFHNYTLNTSLEPSFLENWTYLFQDQNFPSQYNNYGTNLEKDGRLHWPPTQVQSLPVSLVDSDWVAEVIVDDAINNIQLRKIEPVHIHRNIWITTSIPVATSNVPSSFDTAPAA